MNEHTPKEQIPNIVRFEVDGAELEGNFDVPAGAQGLVIFAHGSGSSRHSSRNRYVASELNQAGMGTLLMDLLTSQEEEVDHVTREYRFDIPRLAQRVEGAVDWLRRQEAGGLPIGLFGASTGAAAALIAAAHKPGEVSAVVSRGGRPDLAADSLPQVEAPTLLIVGGADEVVIDMNQKALEGMPEGTAQLSIVSGATHLFPEPGKLEEVARLASDWFKKHLRRSGINE